eukprot:4525254-Pleurochrysis_carterae.AAC.3
MYRRFLFSSADALLHPADFRPCRVAAVPLRSYLVFHPSVSSLTRMSSTGRGRAVVGRQTRFFRLQDLSNCIATLPFTLLLSYERRGGSKAPVSEHGVAPSAAPRRAAAAAARLRPLRVTRVRCVCDACVTRV